jgi:iron complex outermembrane receptor protein
MFLPLRPRRALLRALAAALLPAAAPAAAAQAGAATIRVVVRHEGEPVRDATVRAGAAGARTDDDGRAALPLPPGDHLLVVARLGFRPESLAVRLAPGADTTVAVALEAQAGALDEMVVSVARTELQIDDEPLRVEVMAGDEIDEKTQMRPADLTYLLREMSGVRVQPTGPSSGAAGIRVQGMRAQYTLLLSDGLPLHGAQPGGLGLLQIPPLDLAQAEVIKGPASALYGTGALGGVLNLICMHPVV